jgi:L-ascorbate metabolism protein UlaG (beta-lactamase superfamily)
MRFRNLDPRHRGPTRWQVFRWAILDRWLGRRRPSPPGPPSPAVTPDQELIRSPREGTRITWLGHASFLVQLGGQNLLIDPVFSERIAWVYPRYARPGLPAAALPPIDVVLISHSHPDHLDLASIEALPRDATAIVPMGLGRLFTRLQFARVIELNWWEPASLKGFQVTLVPARHWSRRTWWDHNRTLWGGYVIGSPAAAIYFAGDSAWCDVFAEIGRRIPGLAAALLPIGGYAPAWFMSQNHLSPEEAGQAFLDSGARVLVPMHWGTFQLTDEPLCEPIARLEAWWREHAPADRRLARLAIGGTLCLDGRAQPTLSNLPAG